MAERQSREPVARGRSGTPQHIAARRSGQMGEGRGVTARIVEVSKLHLTGLHAGPEAAQRQATDAPETVDANM